MRSFQSLWKRSDGVASDSYKDRRVSALDLFGMVKCRGYIQDVQAGDTHQFRAKGADDLRHTSSLEAHIDDADHVPMRAERRGNVLQAQRLSAKKRSKAEMSGQMSRFDE